MTHTARIPLLDLVTPHQELESELLAVAKKAFATAGFIGGPMVDEFEREFAAFCNTKYCVGVNSGTDALRFAFLAAGVAPGDIVVTVPVDIEYGAGVSKEGCLLDLALENDIVQKSGSFFSYGELRLGQGRTNTKQYLAENPELARELEAKLYEALGIEHMPAPPRADDEAPPERKAA